MTFVGIDGCHGGWLAVEVDENGKHLGTSARTSFEELSEEYSDAELALVDVPIGLRSSDNDGDAVGTPRLCDSEARSAIYPRSSSVFQVPIREAVEAWETHHNDEDAIAKQREVTGKSLTSQSLGIIDKIAEIEEYLPEGRQDNLRESHPEVCFAALNGGEPLNFSKSDDHSDAGIVERIGILEDSGKFDAGDALSALADATNQFDDVTFDDVLDAFVLAVTASKENRSTLPEDSEEDERGRQMEMVYAPEDAFND
ncbi:DUF429 domain-containing protein [Haloferax sp. YSSS75]|uniref:DUF429 domain-containing protein n=1 Tax=Haloferax sp. YSSS75 TaxID=3388564 RepID=UPI00398D501D